MASTHTSVASVQLFPRATEPAYGGFTLIEVVIAALVAAMAVMAVFSVILSSFVGGAKADRRQEGVMIMRKAAETLRMYVSDDYTITDNDFKLPGSPPGHWSADTTPGWALANVSHYISGSFLNDTRLKNGSLSYVVSEVPCVDIGTPRQLNCKKAVFTLTYPD